MQHAMPYVALMLSPVFALIAMTDVIGLAACLQGEESFGRMLSFNLVLFVFMGFVMLAWGIIYLVVMGVVVTWEILAPAYRWLRKRKLIVYA